VFERFTDQARRVVVLSQEEARLLAHDHIGAEHLLLGLVHPGDGVAARALAAVGLTLEGVRAEVERVVGRGEGPTPNHIPFTPGAKRTLEGSLREALRGGEDHIDTEHILLGLLGAEDPVVGQVFEALGTDSATVRQQSVDLIPPSGPSGPARRWTLVGQTGPELPLSRELSALLGEAIALAQEAGASSVTPEHLMQVVARRLGGSPELQEARGRRVTRFIRRSGRARAAPGERPSPEAGQPEQDDEAEPADEAEQAGAPDEPGDDEPDERGG
jgi:ATP-dependent Clp protease ATP-binding subunit ClpC